MPRLTKALAMPPPIRPLASPSSYRSLAFLLSALPLGWLWLTVLIVGWSVTLAVAITPLVLPAAIGFALIVRGCAFVETALIRKLLGGKPRAFERRARVKGFWHYVWSTISDPALWRSQAYLLLRASLGQAIALGLFVALVTATTLICAPILYFSIPQGFDIGNRHIHSLGLSVALVPLGVVALIATFNLLAPLASLWRTLSSALIDRTTESPRVPGPRADGARTANDRALLIHALVVCGVNLFLILIWALTSRGYFWPIWTILPLGSALAMHGCVSWVNANPHHWLDRRLDQGFAIHAGVWAVLLLFFMSIWAITSRGYFWPVWVLLLALLALIPHALSLLMRSPERRALAERISVLESSRAGAVDVQEAELRRIERDLHDGAQARLVALGMSLGMAEQKLATDADAARQLLAEARTGAGEALRELRDLARGIHPPVLADRGLEAAIRALAAASPAMVTVSVFSPERPKPPVESAAYFVVAEALANAGKHAEASRLDVRVTRSGDNLCVEVHDDGKGGADPGGGGLSGLRRRVEALDGTLQVISPAGGPTTIRAELPCG